MHACGRHLGTMIAGLALTVSPPGGVPRPEGCRSLRDAFNDGALNPDRWLFTSAGARGTVRRETVAGRLRVSSSAAGVDDGTAEHVGVVHPRPFAVDGLDVAVQTDWPEGDEAVGTAAVYLAPVLTWSSPEREADWLKFAYEAAVARRAPRVVLTLRRAGSVRLLAANAGGEGSRRGAQAMRLELAGRALRVFLNGVLWHESSEAALPFRSAYLYLQSSGRRDARRRDVFFDDVSVRAACGHPPAP